MPADPLDLNNVGMVAGLALGHRLPAIYALREFPDAGGLLSYGPNVVGLVPAGGQATWTGSSRAPSPAGLPMEQPTQFDFVLNLQTAQAIGLTIPPSVVQQATEVIQ